MKNSNNKIHEKLSVPSAPTNNLGNPNKPSPATRTPTRQATANENTVLRVVKANITATAAGTNDRGPI
ncbi:hypothetical protein [uncultured Paraglaciecola sp.]|uniref:hypothetical protein n=1 Tax=uncultured Paraglaciecola sp. TaxID=1765024 RepID=UPI0026172A8E|nr:hypothetical protein [uncultured Paraglaciecola sp.]